MFRSLLRAALPGVLGLGLTVAATACGDDAKSDPAAFVGTWKITTGQLTPSCPTLPVQPVSLVDETITVTPGTDSALIAVQRNCMVKLDISGNVATAKPNQTCATTVPLAGVQVSLTLSVTMASFTVVEKTATFMQTGTGTLATPLPGLAGTCPYSITASATKTL